MLHHENLDAYRAAVEFVGIAHAVAVALPADETAMRDQLRRAALSIPLNIAEGAGKVTLRDRQRYYAVARGSALECAAAFDVLVVCGLGTDEELHPGRALLVRVVSMLTRMFGTA